MNTKQTLLAAGALSAMMLSSTLAQAQVGPRPLVITNVAGDVRIQQGLPCGNTLDVTTPIARGRLEMTWLPLSRGEVLFDLTQVNLLLTPFHAEATCNGVGGSVDFREIGIQLASAIRFTGVQTDGLESRLYRFSIPKEQFLIFESVRDTADVPQPETSYQRPSEDVTILIDLRRQTAQLHVVLTTELRFRAGCSGDRCVIDETRTGTTTTDILGGDFGGITPPTVTCTRLARPENSFQVSASDDATIALGTFTLANNEVIQLLQADEPGVRLLPANRRDGIRQFQVGPGEAFILATNLSNLSAIAYCR